MEGRGGRVQCRKEYGERLFYGNIWQSTNLKVNTVPQYLKLVIIHYLVEWNFKWHGTHTPKFWKLNLNHEIDPLHILIRVLHKLHSLITLEKQETRKEEETLKNVQILYLQKLPHSMEPRTSINSTSLFLVFKNPLKFIRRKGQGLPFVQIQTPTQLCLPT